MRCVLWQLRHSCESFARSRAISRAFILGVCAAYFSGVSIIPVIVPQTSLEASILRIILGKNSLGTWQSEQVAFSPAALLKWLVCCICAHGWASISWQLIQNSSVLVACIVALKAKTPATPSTPPIARRLSTERLGEGCIKRFHQSVIRDKSILPGTFSIFKSNAASIQLPVASLIPINK